MTNDSRAPPDQPRNPRGLKAAQVEHRSVAALVVELDP